MGARQKHYTAPKRFDTQEPGMLGPWDGRKRPALPASVRQSRQHQPYGGLSQEEWQALSPEQKLALAHGGTISE